jgi:hypothetical protein
VERNNKYRNCLVAVYNNRMDVPTLENAAYAFADEHWGKTADNSVGIRSPRSGSSWAKELCASERFSSYKVFVLIHSYMGAGDNAPLLGKIL